MGTGVCVHLHLTQRKRTFKSGLNGFSGIMNKHKFKISTIIYYTSTGSALIPYLSVVRRVESKRTHPHSKSSNLVPIPSGNPFYVSSNC